MTYDLHQQVEVRLRHGHQVQASDRPITVEGTFIVDVVEYMGKVHSIYRLRDSIIVPKPASETDRSSRTIESAVEQASLTAQAQLKSEQDSLVQISDLRIEKKPWHDFKLSMVPEAAKQLMGKRIRIKAHMIPNGGENDVSVFVLDDDLSRNSPRRPWIVRARRRRPRCQETLAHTP